MISSLEKLFSREGRTSNFDILGLVEFVKAAEDHLHLLSNAKWLSLRTFALAAIGVHLRPGKADDKNGMPLVLFPFPVPSDGYVLAIEYLHKAMVVTHHLILLGYPLRVYCTCEMSIPLWKRLQRLWTTKLERIDYLRFLCENGWLWKTNEDWRSIMDRFPESEIFAPLCPLLAGFRSRKSVARRKWREIGTENTIPR